MSESQKGKSVQRNQLGNQKQISQTDEINENKDSGNSEQSSGSEEEEGLTEEINGQGDFKHPHKHGNSAASDNNNENSI